MQADPHESPIAELPSDELKIDRSLILDVLDSGRDRLIIKSTVDLAHGLGMTVVAKGVETKEVFDVLATLSCDTIQGYWISRPLPFESLVSFLTPSETTTASSGPCLGNAA